MLQQPKLWSNTHKSQPIHHCQGTNSLKVTTAYVELYLFKPRTLRAIRLCVPTLHVMFQTYNKCICASIHAMIAYLCRHSNMAVL